LEAAQAGRQRLQPLQQPQAAAPYLPELHWDDGEEVTIPPTE